MISIITVTFLIFIALQVLDIISTYRALKRPGIVEKNLIMRWLMDRIGVLPAMILAKTIAAIPVAGVLYIGSLNQWWYIPVIVISACNIAYVFVVINNFKNGD